MMYLNPDLILFHNVLSDSEIETIMEIFLPMLVRRTFGRFFFYIILADPSFVFAFNHAGSFLV